MEEEPKNSGNSTHCHLLERRIQEIELGSFQISFVWFNLIHIHVIVNATFQNMVLLPIFFFVPNILAVRISEIQTTFFKKKKENFYIVI